MNLFIIYILYEYNLLLVLPPEESIHLPLPREAMTERERMHTLPFYRGNTTPEGQRYEGNGCE